MIKQFIFYLKSICKTFDQKVYSIDQISNFVGNNFKNIVSEFEKRNLILFRDKFSKSYFKSLKLQPDAIIDVGVYKGTPALYETFVDKKIYLVDPFLNVHKSFIRKKFKQNKFIFMQIALSSKKGTKTIRHHEITGHNSFYKRYAVTPETGELSNVKVDTLDNLFHGKLKKIGLKIDSEGHELHILKGGKKLLNDVEFIVAEIPVKNIFSNSYKFSDLISFLSSYGFEVFDILNARGFQPNFFDVMFLKKDNNLFKKN